MPAVCAAGFGRIASGACRMCPNRHLNTLFYILSYGLTIVLVAFTIRTQLTRAFGEEEEEDGTGEEKQDADARGKKGAGHDNDGQKADAEGEAFDGPTSVCTSGQPMEEKVPAAAKQGQAAEGAKPQAEPQQGNKPHTIVLKVGWRCWSALVKGKFATLLMGHAAPLRVLQGPAV